MPHGHCYYWEPFILWSHAISDSVIALAYFAIPVSLFRIVRKQSEFKYIWIAILFALFILSCGITHLMDVVVIWKPYYFADSVIRIITAVVSISTAVVLIKITPQIIQIPSVERWKKMNHELKLLNERLEEKVMQRTQALTESAATFEFVTDTIPQMVWTAPANGQLDYFNQKWYNYTQLDYTASMGSGWLSVIHPDDQQGLRNLWYKSIQEGNKFQMECRIRNGNTEEYCWHLLRALAMTDEQQQVTKWFGTATDIDEQKRKTVELKKVNEELDNFVYTASHDLKAPLTNLEGLMSMLYNNGDAANKAPTFDMVRQQLAQLRLVISDLGDIGRIEKEASEDFAKVSLRQVIEEFKSSNRQLIQSTSTKIHTDLDADELFFSIISLRSLVYNLLENGIKYRKPTLPPVLRVRAFLEGGHWILKVTDNGQGIPKKFHDRVFDMFKRYHRDSKGTGIGLYIVKRIAEKHEGQVRVESVPDEGSTFIVSIPEKHLKKKEQANHFFS